MAELSLKSSNTTEVKKKSFIKKEDGAGKWLQFRKTRASF